MPKRTTRNCDVTTTGAWGFVTSWAMSLKICSNRSSGANGGGKIGTWKAPIAFGCAATSSAGAGLAAEFV